MDKLKTNPYYDFVILHIGQEDAGAYKQVEKCRKFSNATMVAESSIFPRGRDEVLEHFDEYIKLPIKTEPLEDVLKKYGCIT